MSDSYYASKSYDFPDGRPQPPSYPPPRSYQYQNLGNVERGRYEQGVDSAANACCGSGPFCGLDDNDVDERKLLLRRVYMALTFQLILTGIVVFLFITSSKALTFLMTAAFPILILATVITFSILIGLMCCGLKDIYPMNLGLLALFTIAMSFLVAIGCGSVTCAVSAEAKVCMVDSYGLGMVAQAFTMTMIIFLSLTIFELQTKKDFSWMGQFLCMGLVILIVWGTFAGLLGFSTGMFYSLFGIILFTGYILYDTSNLVNQYGPDDWIIATIQLYLDIINLFLYILKFLQEINGRNNN